MDFGCHDEAFIDQDRVNFLRKNYEEDFKIESKEKDWKDLRSCLRPQSIDDFPIVGALKQQPNVLVNLGHGGHGTSISFSCAKVIDGIIKGDKTGYFDSKVIGHIDSKRCMI